MRRWRSFRLHIPVLFVFVLMRAASTVLSLNDLLFLLRPVCFLIHLLTGSSPVFIEGEGYLFSDLNIIIGLSCSGYTFWSLCFLVIAFSVMRITKTMVRVAILIPIAILLSYLLTIVVNTIRILISIYTQEIGNLILSKQPHFLIHEITGTLVYILSLLLIFMLISSLLKKTPHLQ